MALGFGKSREDDVVALIAAKKYARAIEVLKAQLSKRGANPSLRMQLADVLILADKKQEAISLLIPLADQFARDGFAAKAVSVLKKIQKIDPGRRDVEERLARQIEERQREAAALPLARPGAGPGGGPAAEFDEGPSLEIGFDAAPISAPVVPGAAPEPQPAARPQSAPAPAPEPKARELDLPDLAAEPASLDLPKAVADAPPDATLPVSPQPRPAAAPTPPKPVATPPASEQVDGEIEDYDLLYYAEEGEEEEVDIPLEAELVEADSAAAEPMSAGQFADELMGLVDSVFQDFTAGAPAPAAAARAAPAAGPRPAAKDESRGGSQIVVSPLFRDFSVDEMVAVIHGLKLVTHERGEVILREGQPGTSLYMLTSGRVRAFKKDAASGKQSPLGDLKEGAFFGEMSILTGQPRMASVVALSRCELLELDRTTLDGITKTHPHVWDVLREFAEKRTARPR